MNVRLIKGCACFIFAISCALFGRPKDVQGCSAAPEEFSLTAFLALFWFHGSQRVCVFIPSSLFTKVPSLCMLLLFALAGGELFDTPLYLCSQLCVCVRARISCVRARVRVWSRLLCGRVGHRKAPTDVE